jgi:hypothetical protein
VDSAAIRFVHASYPVRLDTAHYGIVRWQIGWQFFVMFPPGVSRNVSRDVFHPRDRAAGHFEISFVPQLIQHEMIDMPMNDFEVWLHRQVGKSRPEIFQNANAAASQAERRLKRIRSATTWKQSMDSDFITRIGQFLFWLHHGDRADGTSDADWQAAQPIRDSLVEQENPR